ncbi:N-6 DNA methylase [Erysipelothrix rhusiopathiae]|nr:N-6 DNA methylase [Erysipelothrix rhusiopathiae]
MAEEKIKCYITGVDREATPEEKVRQAYLQILVEDYGYKKSDIKLEYGVKRSPSDTQRSLPVDIAIFENGKPKIFVETKQPTVKAGIDQLKDYMNFTPDVKFGVWTNGSQEEAEQSIHYIEKNYASDTGVIDYVDILNIPEKGFYTIDEQLKRSELRPTNNLRNIFKQMRGFIAGNATGTTRDESILNELMSILMCKIYDERYTDPEDFVSFIVIDNDNTKTAKRIKNLFVQVKMKYPEVFTEHDEINLTNEIITYVVAQLQKYSITESSHQIVSDAFESIISYASKGSQGQFFTPKNVVDLMVNILNPKEYKKIIDPALGTAGFLTSTMNYVWNEIDKKRISKSAVLEDKKEYAMKYLYGIEKDSFLAKISKAYMAILGDGRSNVFIEDSLNTDGWGHAAKASIHNNSYDYVLTNPPFGKDIKIKKETAKKYEFNEVDLMFLERSFQLLHDGGILGIILPETIFHSPTNKVIRDKLFEKHNLIAMVDLPHDTFRPYNNAKCDIVFFQKNTVQQEKVLCIKVDNIGHNHNGQVVYMYDLETNTYDKNIINDDIPKIIDALKNNVSLDNNIKYVDFKNIKEKDILVARYYFEEEITTPNSITLQQLIDDDIIMHFDGHGSPKGHLKGCGEYPYVRVKDIVNLEVYINHMDKIPKFEYERLFRNNKTLKKDDIAFVRRGSYRIGDVGILYDKDLKSIFTREILIIRIKKVNNKYGITPFNLLYLMNTDDFKKQLPNKIMMDTTLPNIGDRWKELRIPAYSSDIMQSVNDKMVELCNSRNDFWHTISDISSKFEIEEKK